MLCPLAMNVCELVESDNDLALVEYATRYDRDFALTCADAATKSATASITKVACPATLGVVAVTPANGHDRCYSGGVYYPAKPDLTSADACAVPGLPTTTAAPGAVRGVEHRRAGEREHHVPQLRQHPPRAVHAKGGWRRHAEVLPEGCLRLRRRRDGGVRCHKDVESTVEGSGLTMMAEAGVTATLDVVAKDVESNRIYAGGERSKVAVAVSGGTTASVSITDLGTGKYQVMIVYPHAGTFTSISSRGATTPPCTS